MSLNIFIFLSTLSGINLYYYVMPERKPLLSYWIFVQALHSIQFKRYYINHYSTELNKSQTTANTCINGNLLTTTCPEAEGARG